jgi:signal transduction histidine kinase
MGELLIVDDDLEFAATFAEILAERGHTVRVGVSLDLATVKRLTEAHGGRVGARAAHPRGSVFWFELPRADARA